MYATWHTPAAIGTIKIEPAKESSACKLSPSQAARIACCSVGLAKAEEQSTAVGDLEGRKIVAKVNHFRALAAVAGALLAFMGALLAWAISPAQGAVTLPAGFTESQVISGLTNPMDMEFAPDGKLFVAEQGGKCS